MFNKAAFDLLAGLAGNSRKHWFDRRRVAIADGLSGGAGRSQLGTNTA
jgi:hypothetical protein